MPIIDIAVTRDDSDHTITVFAINRDPDGESITLTGDVRSFGGATHATEASHTVLAHPDDPFAINTADDPTRVVPQTGASVRIEGGKFSVELAPLSWNVLRFLVG